MWEAWEYLSSWQIEEGKDPVSSSASPCTTPAPALSRETEEVEVQNGPVESDSRAFSSSSSGSNCGFIGSTSNAAGLETGDTGRTSAPSAVELNLGQLRQRELPVDDEGCLSPPRQQSSGSTSAPSALEPNLGAQLRQRELLVDDEGCISPPHQTKRSGWSSARGVATRRLSSAAAASPQRGLKEIQLQKLGRLEALDRGWDRLYLNETEERFEWPWERLTEEQIALGKLDFRKFIALLCALSQTGLEPENALSLEQISVLDSLPLEEIPGYVASEVAVRHKIPDELFSDVKDMKRWLEKDGPVSFECHVDENDVCKYKIVQQRPASTVLHRTYGGDRVMLVFFSERPRSPKRFQKGICVGLRRYRLWTFKDTGKEEFKGRSDPTEEDHRKAVRGYFVCTESLADIDLDDPKFKYITRIHAARCHIMNIHNVQTLSNYCFRLQLALSQSTPVPLNIPGFEFEQIDDLLSETFDDKNKALAFTNGTGEMSPDVANLLDGLAPPSLVQHRTYKSGMALKGTFQVNHKLKGLKIRYRPSMRKVDDQNRLVLPIIDDTLEILNTTSRKPRTANLCVDLIILLSLGGVPVSFFEQLVQDAIEKIKNIFTDFDLAMAEVENSDPEFDSYRDETYRMLLAGFPMNHPYLQKNLRYHVQDKIKGLRGGCVPLQKSFYLMGTADPTQERILKPNQVAITMERGKFFCGKVLVYKNPGKHWGDVHVFDAVWDKVLVEYLGQAEHTIFFSTQGDRPVVDEIAKADLDGDLFWICTNTEVISSFQPSCEPWKRPSSRTGQAKKDQLPPSKNSPAARESYMFNRFINACIESGRPSSMKMAATYWKIYMDVLLMMKDEERTSGTVDKDLDSIYQKLEQLINLFYRAVDAEKNDDVVYIPNELIPVKRPHHMKTDFFTERDCYTSTSVLGRLFDMTDINADSLGRAACPWEETLEYDPNFEYGQFRDHLEVWSKQLKQYNRETRSKRTKEERAQVLDKYKKMFFAHESLDEASAIYYANYEHVKKTYSGSYDPSFYFAMQVAGIELYKIYAENLTKRLNVDGGNNAYADGEPYVTAYSVRRKLVRPRR